MYIVNGVFKSGNKRVGYVVVETKNGKDYDYCTFMTAQEAFNFAQNNPIEHIKPDPQAGLKYIPTKGVATGKYWDDMPCIDAKYFTDMVNANAFYFDVENIIPDDGTLLFYGNLLGSGAFGLAKNFCGMSSMRNACNNMVNASVNIESLGRLVCAFAKNGCTLVIDCRRQNGKKVNYLNRIKLCGF